MDLMSRLKDSKTVLFSYYVNDPNIDLASTKDLRKYKMFLCDTGLFVTLAYKNKNYTENIIYEKMMNDKLSTNMGYIYENVVAQMLNANGIDLYYHTFINEKRKRNYEIDFLLSRNNKLVPIEVKSSGYRTHSSLDAFEEKYSERIDESVLIYTKDIKKEDRILLLPVYMAMFLN